jgi:hypothetical protein
MTASLRQAGQGALKRLVAAGILTLAAWVGAANAAEIDADCGQEMGDPITLGLKGKIAGGDASTLRNALHRCTSRYDADAVRAQADAVSGPDARKRRAALDARADALEAQKPGAGKRPARFYLDSAGGDPAEAMAIGRLARQEQLTTIVDVGGTCSDACLLAFTGGVVRKTAWGADIQITHAVTSGQASLPEMERHLLAMGTPKRGIDTLHDGAPHRLTKAAAYELGISGADQSHVDRVKAAFVAAWGKDAGEIMEASAAFEASARSCAADQSDPSPINARFVACVTRAGEPLQRWQRYLDAIRMIDALQAAAPGGLPDHRFFVEITGDWSF